MYQWEFEKGKETLNDAEIQLRAALDGVGVVWTLEHYAAPFIAAGTLLRVLEDWCPPFPGYFLYYPSRRQQPGALSALIETLRRRHHRSGRTGCHHPHVYSPSFRAGDSGGAWANLLDVRLDAVSAEGPKPE